MTKKPKAYPYLPRVKPAKTEYNREIVGIHLECCQHAGVRNWITPIRIRIVAPTTTFKSKPSWKLKAITEITGLQRKIQGFKNWFQPVSKEVVIPGTVLESYVLNLKTGKFEKER